MNHQPRGRHLAAALLLAATAGGAAAAEPPVYSLVVARQTRFYPNGDYQCVWLGERQVCPRHASANFDHARSLAGPTVREDLGAGTELGPAGHYAPVLVILSNPADGDAHVVAQAVAGADGRACLDRPTLDRLGWRPAGPEIIESKAGVCVDLSPLAALPVPEAQRVMSIEELGRLRRARRR